MGGKKHINNSQSDPMWSEQSCDYKSSTPSKSSSHISSPVSWVSSHRHCYCCYKSDNSSSATWVQLKSGPKGLRICDYSTKEKQSKQKTIRFKGQMHRKLYVSNTLWSAVPLQNQPHLLYINPQSISKDRQNGCSSLSLLTVALFNEKNCSRKRMLWAHSPIHFVALILL